MPLIQLSTDTTSAHAMQVKPDTYTFGSTMAMAAQTGRFNHGSALDLADQVAIALGVEPVG